MHGVSLLLLKGRERTAGVITTFLFLILAALSPQPRRRIVDGQEIVEPIFFGHVIPMWLLIAIALPVIGVVHISIHRLLLRFWPEKETQVKVNVTDYLDAPQVERARSAEDYLRVSMPEPISSRFDGTDWLEDFGEFQKRQARWLATATDATLGDLVTIARQLGDEFSDQTVHRLAQAHEKRGIPTLKELETLATEIDSEELREYVRERKEELKEAPESFDKVYQRPEGGLVAWKGEDPEAGSPFDYVKPQIRSTLDYLQAEEPAPMRILILGQEEAAREEAAFNAELQRWLREASKESLRDLVPAAKAMRTLTPDAYWRLTEAHEARGIPTLDELASLAHEIGDEELRTYVSERRAEEA